MKINNSAQPAAGSSSSPDTGTAAVSSSASGSRRPERGSHPVQSAPRRAGSSRSPSPDAPVPQAAAAAPHVGLEDLQPELLHKIRIALAPNAAPHLALTSKAMHAAFQPRATADKLWHRAANPEMGAAAPLTAPELITHFVGLLDEAVQLPEDLRPPVLTEILWQASLQMDENSVGIEDVALAYLRGADSVIDLQVRCAVLCDLGHMLDTPRFRRQCIDPGAPQPPRPTVDRLAQEFSGRCLGLGLQTPRPAEITGPLESLPPALQKSLVARRRWKEHLDKDPTDRVRLNAAVLSSMFMMPAAVRVKAWKKMGRMCQLYPVEVRAPLLQALSASATTLGATEDCVNAIRQSVALMQGQDAALQAKILGCLINAVQGSADRDLKNGAPRFFFAEVNKLPAQFRRDLLEPLIDAMPSIDDQNIDGVLDIILSKVSELSSADQAAVLACLYRALRVTAPGPARLTMFDRMWHAMPDVDAGCRGRLRNDLTSLIRNLPPHVRAHRFFRAVGDARKLRGTALSAVLPLLLRNIASLDSATVAATGFCDVAALVGHLPVNEQALQLRTLYDYVGRLPDSQTAYAFLTVLDRTAAELDDGDRVGLIGSAARRTAWLPLPMFADQLDALVAQANELVPAVRDQAYAQIVQALTDALETPAIETDLVRAVMFPTIVHGIGELPLVMRVPLLVSATRALDSRGDFPDRQWISELVVTAAHQLPSEMRRQLQESLVAVNCRHLFGYI